MPDQERAFFRTYRSTGLLRAAVLATTMLSLGGCGNVGRWWETKNDFMVSADQLCESLPDQVWGGDNTCVQRATATKPSNGQSVTPPTGTGSTPLNGDGLTNKEYLARVVNESEYKCSAFLNGLVLASNTTSTVLDSMTTVFSALGTVFTPLGTVHALTAGGTISSGFNGVIRSDIYAQQAVANYAQAIESSYYDAIQQYLTDLIAVPDDTTLVRAAEVARIRIIHKSCTLASAQQTISATLRSESGSTAAQTVTTVTVTADAKPKDVYTLTGTGGLTATYTASGVASAATVASALVNQIIDPAQKFVAAGVTVSQPPGQPNFKLSAPSTIKWTTSGALSATSAASASTAGSTPAAPADAGAGAAPASTGTTVTTSVTSHVRNPGSALR